MRVQPKYKIGQKVKVVLHAQYAKNLGIEQKVVGLISEIIADEGSGKDTYRYGITQDMPGYNHSGKRPFIYIMEEGVVLDEE